MRSAARPIAAVLLVALPLLAGSARRAEAGPPLICWEIAIGDAKSLPWGSGAFGARDDYDIDRLVPDTLALLGPETPVLVRLETMRRATVYASEHGKHGARGRAAAWELAARLMARVLDEEGREGARSYLPWLDAGYFVGACAQASLETGLDGYAWASRADQAKRPSAEAQFALALMTAMGEANHARFAKHMRGALEGASDGSLLAKNLRAHFGSDGAGLDALRARYGAKQG